MSSKRSPKRPAWRLVAITTGKHLGATMTLLGMDAKDSHRSVADDGHMFRIYRRFGKRMKPFLRKGRAS